MKKKQVLINAQKTGAIVKVKYTIGSQPNHAREIIPLRIDDDKVFAKCLNSNSEKFFQIDKLILLNDRQFEKHLKWDANAGFLTDYEEFIMMKEKRNKLFRYFSMVFGVVLVFLIYLFVKSKR